MTHALLIVGGGPAGLSAARAFRDAGGEGAVAIITDEGRMPYQRPPLTKELLRGEAAEHDLPLEEESWLIEHAVDLVMGRAVALDADERRVTLSGGRALEYDRCVLATGAEPVRLPVSGADDPAVRVLRTLDHLRDLQARLRDGEPAIVIGSGFIGCEIGASLALRGHPVSLISDETLPNERRLGAEAGQLIAGWLTDVGVTPILGAEVDRIARDDSGLEVRAGPHRLRAPVVVMATGVAPCGELLASAGVELADGAVPVDSAMRSPRPGVLAAGDVAFAVNATAGRPLRVEHWGDALAQGAVAGRTAAGVAAAWDEVPGFWSTIGSHTLKYAAWGDGHDVSAMHRHPGGGFVVRYGREGRLAGVLAHEDDDAYAAGRQAIVRGASWSG